jgi:hypothetical protein
MLQPWWARALLWAVGVGGVFAATKCVQVLLGRRLDPWRMVTVVVVLAVLVGLAAAAATHRRHRAYLEALEALSPTDQLVAIDASWRGPVPDDIGVRDAAIRAAAIRLGAARGSMRFRIGAAILYSLGLAYEKFVSPFLDGTASDPQVPAAATFLAVIIGSGLSAWYVARHSRRRIMVLKAATVGREVAGDGAAPP